MKLSSSRGALQKLRTPGTKTVPGNSNVPGTKPVPPSPGTKTVPTIEISGGGGGRGGRFLKSHRTALPQAEPPGLQMWSVPVLIELEWSNDWQRYYGEVIGQARPAPLRVDDKLSTEQDGPNAERITDHQ